MASSTPAKRRRLNSKEAAASISKDSLDLSESELNAVPDTDTQTALLNAGEDIPVTLSTDEGVTIPQSTLEVLVASLNSLNETVSGLVTTVNRFEKKLKLSTKECKGLKRVVKALCDATNHRTNGDNTPPAPKPKNTQHAPIPKESDPVPEAPTRRDDRQRTQRRPTTQTHRADPPQVSSQSSTQDIWELKRKVVPQWGRKYFYRSKEWGRAFINITKRQALDDHLQRDPVYIAPKFRQYHGRDAAHFKIIENKCINNMRSTRDEYNLNAQMAKENVERVDVEMLTLIRKHKNRAERDQLTELWKKEIEAGQTYSIDKTRRSFQWLDDLPTEKPYYGYDSCRPQMKPQPQRENTAPDDVHNSHVVMLCEYFPPFYFVLAKMFNFLNSRIVLI